MAAQDFNRFESEKQGLFNTINCCICMNVFTDPKDLPCNHTFCVKCLEQTGININKGPGDEMPCPICRRQFTIHQEGFSGLPNNFFIAKLIQVANDPNPSKSSNLGLCEVCLEEKEEMTEEISKADMFCTDCNQKLCEECCKQHSKFKLNQDHKLIPINNLKVLASDENTRVILAPSVCEPHKQRVLDIYCDGCKTVVCAVCFIEDHKQHNGSHVSKFEDDFRKQIQSNIEIINGCSSQAQMKKKELDKIKEDMQQKVKRLESDVISRRDELKQFTDSQANSLLQSICSLSQSKFKEIQMEVDDTDEHMSCLQTYISFCQIIMTNGSASDICRAATDLSAKAVELQGQCQSLTERKIPFFEVTLTKSEIKDSLEDLIGEIEDDCNSSRRKTTTSKAVLIKKQSNEIGHLKETIDWERREKETFRLENEQLKMNVNSEKTTNKKLEVDNDRLMQELETQRKRVQNLLKEKEEARKEWMKTKTELTKENEQLISQNQELRRSLDKLRSEYKLDAILLKTIKTKAAEEQKKSIAGLTILDNELFVVSEMSSEVEVYSSITFGFTRQWNLKELIQPQDIVSCNTNKCLYIFDYKGILSWSNEIFRVDPNGNIIKKWSTGSNFGYSLSVTNESNVILPVYNASKLNEYSPDGELIQELCITSGQRSRELGHAVKLANGHFVVSLHSEYLLRGGLNASYGLCLVDGSGKPNKVFGGEYAANIGYMNVPFHLAVDVNGYVMVVDRVNSRVLLLDPHLEFKSVILSKEERHGLRRPSRILLEESTGRLFLADNEPNNQRILIFKFKEAYLVYKDH